MCHILMRNSLTNVMSPASPPVLDYTAVSRTIWPRSNNESQQTITSIMQEKFHFLLVFHLKNFTPYIPQPHTTHSKEQYAKVNRSSSIVNVLNSTNLTIYLSLKVLVFAVFRVHRVFPPGLLAMR